MEIKLYGGEIALIDDEDWPLVEGLKMFVDPDGYVRFNIKVKGKWVSRTLHNHLMRPPKGMLTDHVHGDKLDNRRHNLRVTDQHRNQVNRHKVNRNSSTGIRGVHYRGNTCPNRPWFMQIKASGITRTGHFATKKEAIAARRAAELELYGELCPA